MLPVDLPLQIQANVYLDSSGLGKMNCTTSTVLPPKDPRRFRFLDLPAELRNKIYIKLLTRDPTKIRGAHPQILATCRKIQNEASNLLYSLNRIDVYVHHDTITWHGSSYRGAGAIHWLLPFNKPRSWHRPSFRFLRMAENLTIHIIHHQHPNCVRYPNHKILHLSMESNWIFKLHENLRWLVRRISKEKHRLKNLHLQLQLDNGRYMHPYKLHLVEGHMLSAFKKMRGVGNLTISPLWDAAYALRICGRVTESLAKEFVATTSNFSIG